MLDPGHAASEQTEPEADDPSTQDAIDDIGEKKGKHQAAHSSKDQPGNEPTTPGTPNPIIRSSQRVLLIEALTCPAAFNDEQQCTAERYDDPIGEEGRERHIQTEDGECRERKEEKNAHCGEEHDTSDKNSSY